MMTRADDTASATDTPVNVTEQHHERSLERLIDRLPDRLQAAVRWLRRPSARWLRFPAGVLLIGGGLLGILPLLGFWMLPLGLTLLAEDILWLRRARDRLLDWIERHRPHWFASTETAAVSPTPSLSRARHPAPDNGGTLSADSHP
jgi:hypothetical protein